MRQMRRIAMNKDELKGTAEQAKGRVQRKAGEMIGDERMQREGRAEEATGELREEAGEAKRKTGEAVEDVGARIKE
jgi:uncharacterized protein YjbJ (UPF0337 family)